MKTILYISILCCLLFSFSGCERPNQIEVNGKKSILRSFMQLKQRMDFKQGTEFEVAFWSLKKKAGNEDAFRSLVNGKTPDEVIEMGKQYFTERKQTNDPDYIQYASWDAMITEVIAQITTPAIKKNQPKTTRIQNKANKIQGF